MRYYSITLTNPKTGELISMAPGPPGSAATRFFNAPTAALTNAFGALAAAGPRNGITQGAAATWSSVVAGPNGSVQNDPGALLVELDVPASVADSPSGLAYISVWGVPLQNIWQGKDINGANIEVSAGFSAGLPLAKPQQAGVILRGTIQQAFGNWIGAEQNLCILAGPATGTNDEPLNFILNWKAGTTLASALATTFSVALPSMKQAINISPNLVLSYDAQGYYATLRQLAGYIKAASKSIIGGSTYPGVDLHCDGSRVVATDGTVTPPPIALEFNDLIGQPTWIESPVVQFKCPMRADLHMFDSVRFPPGIPFTTTAASLSQFRNEMTFTGNFAIIQIRHVGHSRQPSAEAWVSVFDCVPIFKSSQ